MVEPGKRADLLLRENPRQAIRGWDAIEIVFLNGEPLSRASLLPPNPSNHE
jgi:hypothetical protein